MSGHSHWAGIKHKKALVDAKRGKVWSKLSKAIIIACKMGGGDPDMNPRLRLAIDAAKAVSIPLDREILHVLPQEFVVDDQDGIGDPSGMTGTRLEVNVHVITCSTTAVQNTVTCVNRAGLEVADTVLTQIAAAEACLTPDEKELGGAHLVFICAGMGGGTGTGAAPVIAEIAKEQGAIVVAMVTYPFNLERARRVKADEGIAKLRKNVDSVIVLDNNRLVKLVPNLPMNEAFAVADEILAKAVGGLVWTITQPSLINIDFADVRAIVQGGGVGFIAVGEGKGTDKVRGAAEGVLKNKLLDVDYEGANGALIHISGGADLTLGDAIKAGEIITEKMDPQANVKWGARLIPGYDGKLEIVAIVTGVKGANIFGAGADEPKKEVSYSDIEIIG